MYRLLLLFLLITGPITAQTAKEIILDFHVEQASLEVALKSLAELGQLNLAFSPNLLRKSKTVTLHKKGTPSTLLKALLKGTPLNHRLIGNKIVLYQKKYFTVSGYIEDSRSKERLIAATVYCPQLQKGTITNEYGFYSMTLPEGSNELVCSYLGYSPKTLSIALDKNFQTNIRLKNGATLEPVIVTPHADDSNPYPTQENAGVISIQTNQAALLPDLAGLPDPIRIAQLLPGIQSGAEGLDGLTVRGGESGQNLLLLDGVPVYIPYHLMGLYSTYNHQTIKSTKVYKSNFPAKFGGRISSVFDVRTREGNQHHWEGSLSGNLLNTSVLLEGPIRKEKGALLLAGRKSFSGFLFNPFFQRTYFRKDMEEVETAFYDFNIKLNYTLSSKDRVYLSVFRGADQMSSFSSFFDNFQEESEVRLDWSNTITSLRWNHIFNDKLFANTTITSSSFDYAYTTLESYTNQEDNEEEEILEELYFVDMRSFNSDTGIKLDFDYWMNATHHIQFGGGTAIQYFAPNLTYFEEGDEELEELGDIQLTAFNQFLQGEEFSAIESFGYVEDQIKIGPSWQIGLGLRLSHFAAENNSFFKLEPRINLQVQATPQWVVQASFNRMVQYLHTVSFSNIRMPNDLWIPSIDNLLPEEAWQGSIGFSYQPYPNTTFTIEGYHKQLENLYTYPEGFDFEEDDFVQLLIQGNGRVNGLEGTIEHTTDKSGAFLSYAYTSATRQFAAINEGVSFSAIRDQPHQLKIHLYHQFTPGFNVSLNWIYNSFGSIPEIIPLGVDQELLVESLEESGLQLSDLFSDYHRLDIGLSYQFKTDHLNHHLKIGAYNVYNRANIAYSRLEFGREGQLFFQPINSLAVRPSLSYSVDF